MPNTNVGSRESISSGKEVPARNTCQKSTSNPAAGCPTARISSAPWGIDATSPKGSGSSATRVPAEAASSASRRSGRTKGARSSTGSPNSVPILMKVAFNSSAACRSRLQLPRHDRSSSRHQPVASSTSTCLRPASSISRRSAANPIVSGTTCRSSWTKPMPIHPVDATAWTRSSTGIGLVSGVSRGPTLPALVQQVATSSGAGLRSWATVISHVHEVRRLSDSRLIASKLSLNGHVVQQASRFVERRIIVSPRLGQATSEVGSGAGSRESRGAPGCAPPGCHSSAVRPACGGRPARGRNRRRGCRVERRTAGTNAMPRPPATSHSMVRIWLTLCTTFSSRRASAGRPGRRSSGPRRVRT